MAADPVVDSHGHHRRRGKQPVARGGLCASLPVAKRPNRRVWHPGFISNILLGAIAALATYLLGAYKLEILNQLGIALVSGIGGGNVLTSLMQRQEATVLKARLEALEETVRSVTTSRRE